MVSTNWTGPSVNSTNWGATTITPTNWEDDDTSAGAILLEIGDNLLTEPSNNLALQ